jgi:hypothetical protein
MHRGTYNLLRKHDLLKKNSPEDIVKHLELVCMLKIDE